MRKNVGKKIRAQERRESSKEKGGEVLYIVARLLCMEEWGESCERREEDSRLILGSTNEQLKVLVVIDFIPQRSFKSLLSCPPTINSL